MNKLIKWFNINMGWFFINGRKQEWWSNYIKEEYFNSKNNKKINIKKGKNVGIDPIHVEELIKNFSNDYNLGYELRRYYLELSGKL
jgi:hypothetical protein